MDIVNRIIHICYLIIIHNIAAIVVPTDQVLTCHYQVLHLYISLGVSYCSHYKTH